MAVHEIISRRERLQGGRRPFRGANNSTAKKDTNSRIVRSIETPGCAEKMPRTRETSHPPFPYALPSHPHTTSHPLPRTTVYSVPVQPPPHPTRLSYTLPPNPFPFRRHVNIFQHPVNGYGRRHFPLYSLLMQPVLLLSCMMFTGLPR